MPNFIMIDFESNSGRVAGGADILLSDDGTEIGRFTNSSSDLVLQTAVSDKDFILAKAMDSFYKNFLN